MTHRRESDGGDAPALRERLQGAHASARHRAVLQAPARGEVELPGLGRVEVTARDLRGAVDLDLRASHQETLQGLRAHAPALAAEVEAARIPVRQVTFEGAPGWASTGDRAPERRGSEAGEEAPEGGAPSPREATPARPRGRVRFVL